MVFERRSRGWLFSRFVLLERLFDAVWSVPRLLPPVRERVGFLFGEVLIEPAEVRGVEAGVTDEIGPVDRLGEAEGPRHDAVLGALVEHVHLLERAESHGEAPHRDAGLRGDLSFDVVLHVGVLHVDLGRAEGRRMSVGRRRARRWWWETKRSRVIVEGEMERCVRARTSTRLMSSCLLSGRGTSK